MKLCDMELNLTSGQLSGFSIFITIACVKIGSFTLNDTSLRIIKALLKEWEEVSANTNLEE